MVLQSIVSRQIHRVLVGGKVGATEDESNYISAGSTGSYV
jgi:hypothetical protein